MAVGVETEKANDQAGRKRFEEELTWETVIERYRRPPLVRRPAAGASTAAHAL